MPEENPRMIPIPSDAAKKLRKGLSDVCNFNVYQAGVRDALNVPKDWGLDVERMVFVLATEKPEVKDVEHAEPRPGTPRRRAGKR